MNIIGWIYLIGLLITIGMMIVYIIEEGIEEFLSELSRNIFLVIFWPILLYGIIKEMYRD